MVDFAGWSMPVQYQSIVEEHHATRRGVGLFDISHMGRLRFDDACGGKRAAEFIDSLVTRRVDNLPPGRIRYALVTNERGGVKDDVLVYRLQDAAGGAYHLVVCNASNRPKVLEWTKARQVAGGYGDVAVSDFTTPWAMIAVQGPRALELVQPIVDCDLAAMKYYTGQECRIGGGAVAPISGIVSRTGYTGEDGVELIVGAAVAETLWSDLLEAGQPLGARAVGLGARDTLRLEAALPLYGHELNEERDPLQAGLNFAIDLDKTNYSGHEALRQAAAQPDRRRLVGLELAGRRPARENCTIVAGGNDIGVVTSGTFSPTLEKPIAMGYVEGAFAEPGTSVEIDVRGHREPASVVKLPFYKRAK